MNKIILHIGAREGSKGIKNKNIKKIFGKPLIYWTLKHAKKIKNVSTIIVNSDSQEILNLAKKMKVDIALKRPKKLSSSKSSKLDAWKFAIKYLKNENLINDNDIFVDFDCTCPLRKIKDTNQMIKRFKSHKNFKKKFDGIFTIVRAKKNPYFNLVEPDATGGLHVSKPMASNLAAIMPTVVARQQAPVVYEHAASTYVLDPAYLKFASSLFEGRVLPFLMPPERCIDIDSELDFKIVEFLMRDQTHD